MKIFLIILIGVFMSHSALSWITENCYFLPGISGRITAGKKVKDFILPFQRSVIKSALNSDGTANKNIVMFGSRQVSKSTLYSWIVTYLMQQSPVQGIVMASSYGQSDLIFRAVKNQILFSEDLKSQFKIRKDFIEGKNHSLFKKIYNSPSSNLGNMAISLLIVDEFAVFSPLARENLSNIQAGMTMSQQKNLILYASNPPSDSQHWSIDFLKALRTDSNVAFYDFTASIKADIYNSKTWAKANPFIKAYLSAPEKYPQFKYTLTEYQSAAIKAKTSQAAEINFRRQYLGQSCNSAMNKFCDISKIKIAGDKIFEDKSLRWAVGIDPSWRHDFFATGILGYDETNGTMFLKPLLFLANYNNRRPSQQSQFNEWNKQKFITVYNTETIDRDKTLESIKSFLSEKKITPEKVTIDFGMSKAWNFDQSFENTEFVYTNPRRMTSAIRFTQKIIEDGKFFLIGNNPCVLQHFDSALTNAVSKSYTSVTRANAFHSVDIVHATVLAVKHISENRQKIYGAFYV